MVLLGTFGTGVIAADSMAKRTLPPGGVINKVLPVTLTITPAASNKAYAVEEYIPSNCVASDVDNKGNWIKKGHVIKWGIFFDSQPRTLTYKVMCAGAGNLKFHGSASFSGNSLTINGDSSLNLTKN